VTDTQPVSLAVELIDKDAAREISKAVSARHSIARTYVRLRRRMSRDATPAQLITLLERDYLAATATTGAALAAGARAAEFAVTKIPTGGAGAKGAALAAAKLLAQQAVIFLPAGAEKLQFQLTAVFALAVADIHGMRLDKDQANALVWGLSTNSVSQEVIATMAQDLANVSSTGTAGAGRKVADGSTDGSHWATTLSRSLPAGAARDFLRTIQTGKLETAHVKLGPKRRAGFEYGIAAAAAGLTQFRFGQAVVKASREAFPPPPSTFPAHLFVPAKQNHRENDRAARKSHAFATLQRVAKETGTWAVDSSGEIGPTVKRGVAPFLGRVAKSVKRITRR
jgi:hypothetical protein